MALKYWNKKALNIFLLEKLTNTIHSNVEGLKITTTSLVRDGAL